MMPTVRYLIAIAILIVFVFSTKVSEKKWMPAIFLAVLIVIGPVDLMRCVRQYAEIIKQRFIKDDVHVQINKDGIQATLKTVPGTGAIEKKETIFREVQLTEYDFLKSVTVAEVSQNHVMNGDFGISFGHPLAAWGHGYYTNQIHAVAGSGQITWINFLNADITVSVEKTEVGPALKIVNRSGAVPNKVGIMEQEIKVTPGKYRFSFWAKGEQDLQEKAIQFVTTTDWYVIDPSSKKQRGYELEKAGPFGWQEFSNEIIVDENGLLTFTIVSKNSGTLYVTDLRLVKTELF